MEVCCSHTYLVCLLPAHDDIATMHSTAVCVGDSENILISAAAFV